MLTVVQDAQVTGQAAPAVAGSMLDQLVRDGARAMLAAALQAEVAAYVEAFADQLDEHGRRLVVRNGYHQSATVLVELVGERLDVGGDLGLQRRGEHRPGTITHELIKHRPRHRGCGLAGHLGVLDYREHGRTFPTSASTPAMIELVWASDHPREGAPLSRHQAEDPSTGFDHCSTSNPLDDSRERSTLLGPVDR